ncbi:MAG: flagellar basal body rod protein FlgB [Armatimonadota bacterium]
MELDLCGDVTCTVLAKTLDATAARQKAIANNIANVETPGYKRVYVSFEEELRRVIESSSRGETRRRLTELMPVQHVDTQSPSRPNGNNVNIDSEIADLAKNTMRQKAIAVLLEAKITMLRSAIEEGRR